MAKGEGQGVALGAMGLMAGLVAASPLQSTIQQLCQRKPVDNTDALMAHAKNARTVEANRIINRQNATIEKLQSALKSSQEQSLEIVTTQEEYIRELERKNRMLSQMNEQLVARANGNEMDTEPSANGPAI